MAPKGSEATNLTAEAFLKEQGVDTKKGLSSAEVAKRIAKYGTNELESEPPKPMWKLVLEQFDDPRLHLFERL
jgi:Ca2+-transporting ATPase